MAKFMEFTSVDKKQVFVNIDRVTRVIQDPKKPDVCTVSFASEHHIVLAMSAQGFIDWAEK